ncbi:hypothetical protein TrLO_g1662 [Triparma laevis f. longispina]|uniref:FAM194 C-terminal domain-containing protein n=1 Tax=Triparma laevis f. longispina TaxID=1714387 RepID=A0A9W7AQ43_9STRA|nr:hypothetical protein TrLO_g1662 [Triparma laevis f. longispina]
MSAATKKTTIHKYASGNTGVVINDTDAGPYSYFYDDSKKNTLLASFAPQGTGFVNHLRSSKPMFTASKTTGSIGDAQGNSLEYFDWQPKRPGLKFGPSKPQKMYINPCLSFFLTDQFDMKMTFRGTNGFHEFNVGKPSRPSYLDRIMTKTLTGHLILDLPKTTPTLKQRQTLLAANPAAANMKKAQEFGWVLPRASPSGREYAQITVQDDLKPVINGGNADIDRLKNFRTTIGKNVLGLKTLLRETAKDPNASVNLGGTGGTGELGVPPSVYKKFVPPPPLPMTVPAHKLLDHITSETPSQLIVVLCSDRGPGECRKAERQFAQIHKKTNTFLKKNDIDPQKHDFKLIVSDNSRLPDPIAKKYNFNVLPMYMMYYGGKLVMIGDKFNGYSTMKEDLEIEIKNNVLRARKNLFLPNDFRFIDPRHAEYKDV